MGNLSPTISVGSAAFNSAGFKVKKPGRRHEIPSWIDYRSVWDELVWGHLCDEGDAAKKRTAEIRALVLWKYFKGENSSESIAAQLDSAGYGTTPAGLGAKRYGTTAAAVEKLIQRLVKRGDAIAIRRGIMKAETAPRQIAEKAGVRVFEPRAAETKMFGYQCDSAMTYSLALLAEGKDKKSHSLAKGKDKKSQTQWKDVDRAHVVGAAEMECGGQDVRDFVELSNQLSQISLLEIGAAERHRNYVVRGASNAERVFPAKLNVSSRETSEQLRIGVNMSVDAWVSSSSTA